ncbi:hypothetical protein [Burkholderia phage vB_BglM_WTB]
MEDIERIKERIAKLLAMADDTSSPEEAAIAATRARRLMDKHQLSALDIHETILEDFAERDATRAFANMPHHLDILAVAVAMYNDCQAVQERAYVNYRTENRPEARTKTAGKKVVFRGYKSDVELAVQMFKYLVDAMSRNCKAFLAGKGYARYPVGVGSKYKDSWSNAVCGRLDAMTKERERLESANVAVQNAGTSLVIIKAQGVDAHFGAIKYRETKTPVARDDASIEAKYQGCIDGHKVEIVKSVEES